jgi:2',3'-cyclic-nucleotide 2'-phosphodiesterase (5'-nucleotidase family)
VEFTVGGAPVDTARVYRVAMTDYLAEGNSGLGRLKSLPQESFLPEGVTDRQVLASYMRRVAVLETRNDGRWSRIGR